MNLEKKILEELKRFNQINRYVLNEQDPAAGDVPPPPGGDVPPPPGGDLAAPAGDVPPPPGGDLAATPEAGAAPEAEAVPEPVDVESDPDVEEVGDEKPEGEEDTEEIDITDLVTTQQEMKDKQDGFMEDMFKRLDDLQSKLENMDSIMDKINSLETKFDRYRDKTPEEKLELRSLDSYPYNQKLTDFFDDKKVEMEKTGKNEYVLTSDEVENFSPGEIKKSFNTYDQEEM
jgi:hypothetical protein